MKNMALTDKLAEDKILVDLFQAYYDARKNKRNTINALAFEKHLESNLFELHEELVGRRYPDKIYCQHLSKGVRFLGAVIKPHRIYVGNRMKGNYYAAIQAQNSIFQKPNRDKEQQKELVSSLNSYLGMMKHYTTYL
jgi:hypothetical protein